MASPKTEATELNDFDRTSNAAVLSPVAVTIAQTDEPEVIELQSLRSEPLPSSSSDLKKERRLEKLGLMALTWSMFMVGWNDGTSGPLLPTIQKHYNIGFTVVSMIFIVNCVGFISGALANIYLSHKVGFGKALVIGAVTQAIAYCILAPAPPFGVFAFAYFFSGFGAALLNAHSVVYTVSLNRNSAAKMGIMSASYGTGALVAPLVSTQFSTMSHWSFHYLVSLGGAVINIALLTLIFRLQHLDTVLIEAGQTVRQQSHSRDNNYSQVLKLRAVHLIALFTLAYVGVEVTLGGWIVTFAIDERGGGSSSGYITSGFFAGIALGRVCLLRVNKALGERRALWLYVFLSIGLELTVWLIPSLIGNAIAVSFIGFFLGPIYPIVMNRTGHLVPHVLISGAVGWIAGVGQAGSALLPFVTGAMSEKFGVISLQPLIVSVLGIMVGLWAAVPPDQRRSE